MRKLSLEALSQRAEAIATEDLLLSINGGTENDCHDTKEDDGPCDKCVNETVLSQGAHSHLFMALKHLIFH